MDRKETADKLSCYSEFSSSTEPFFLPRDHKTRGNLPPRGKGISEDIFFFFAATLENEIEAREAVKQALTHMGSFPYSEPFCHKKKITKTKSPQNHIAQNVNSAALERDLEKLHTEK